jgi:hypothetical protein
LYFQSPSCFRAPENYSPSILYLLMFHAFLQSSFGVEQLNARETENGMII